MAANAWRPLVGFLAGLCGVAGTGLLVAALTIPAGPPQPASGAELSGLHARNGGPSLRRAEPVEIQIPTIKLKAPIVSVGVDKKRELEVPPLTKAHLAGWYRLGVTPGEIGNAVIVGHVDSSKTGPAVFYNIGNLKPGARINVIRKDKTVATFKVDGVKSFPKAKFPSELVYGGSGTAQLRLITCGGKFDKKRKNYLDNVIVFATYSP